MVGSGPSLSSMHAALESAANGGWHAAISPRYMGIRRMISRCVSRIQMCVLRSGSSASAKKPVSVSTSLSILGPVMYKWALEKG